MTQRTFVSKGLWVAFFLLVAVYSLPIRTVRPFWTAELSSRSASASEPAYSARSNKTIKLGSFRYLHIPKTGTSFIIVLRNYLDSCPVKHFACPGVQGGGGEIIDKASGKPKMKLFNFGVKDGDMVATQDCGGKLMACGKPPPNPIGYHASWRNNVTEVNVVTMLREPLARLFSYWNWYRMIKDSLPEKLRAFEGLIEGCAANMTMSKDCMLFASDKSASNVALNMLAGFHFETKRKLSDNDFARARIRLLNQTVFFGLTDMWKESVCTFHCELGGETMPSEMINTRDNGGFKKEQLVAGLKPAVLEIVDRNLAREYRLFEEAREIFLDRAKRCGCLDPPKGQTSDPGR